MLPKFCGLKGNSAYDEVTSQASSLVDDRDRHSRDPFHLLFRATARLRGDALRSIRSHLRSECFDVGSPANGALVQPGAGPWHVGFHASPDSGRAGSEPGLYPVRIELIGFAP